MWLIEHYLQNKGTNDQLYCHENSDGNQSLGHVRLECLANTRRKLYSSVDSCWLSRVLEITSLTAWRRSCQTPEDRHPGLCNHHSKHVLAIYFLIQTHRKQHHSYHSLSRNQHHGTSQEKVLEVNRKFSRRFRVCSKVGATKSSTTTYLEGNNHKVLKMEPENWGLLHDFSML